MIAHNPLHGSGRAGVPHPALALGDDAHAAQGIGMTDSRPRQPASDETPHAIPKNAAILAPPLLSFFFSSFFFSFYFMRLPLRDLRRVGIDAVGSRSLAYTSTGCALGLAASSCRSTNGRIPPFA